MASQKQIEANRSNAKNSTEPQNDTGKAIGRMNAITHGMTASVTVLKHENPQLLAELHTDLVREYEPQTRTEYELVERLAPAFWRARRIPRFEQALFAWLSVQNTVHYHGGKPGDGLSYPELDKFRTTMPPDEFQELYLGRVLMDALQRDLPFKMARYEQHMTREINKTIELLSRLQNDRQKKKLPGRSRALPQATQDVKMLTMDASPRLGEDQLNQHTGVADMVRRETRNQARKVKSRTS